MSSAANEMIVYLWIGFLLLMLGGLGGLFYWAVRSRQFAEQDRARSLPLEAPRLEEKMPAEEREKG